MTPEKFCIEPYPCTIVDPRSGVQDGLGVWRRDDEAEVEVLDELLFAELKELCRNAGEHMRDRQAQESQHLLIQALNHLPEPLGRWNVAGWALLALGHVAVTRENWELARSVLSDAMWSPGVFGNPWAHRLKGQTHLALGEQERALDDLMRAYRALGSQILEGLPQECVALVDGKLDQGNGVTPQT